MTTSMSTNRLCVEIRPAQVPSARLSVAKAAAVLDVSLSVVRKGLAGGTIADLDMVTISQLATREVLTRVEVDGQPVPVLRPDLASPEDGSERRFAGWRIDASLEETTLAMDRWWTPPGKSLILGAGGYLVAVGSVVCACFMLRSTTLEHNDEGRIRYDVQLAGVLRGSGEKAVDPQVGPVWSDLAHSTLGRRVLGGEGGNFTRIG